MDVYTDVTLECDITVSGENESIHDVVWTIDGSDVTSLSKGNNLKPLLKDPLSNAVRYVKKLAPDTAYAIFF